MILSEADDTCRVAGWGVGSPGQSKGRGSMGPFQHLALDEDHAQSTEYQGLGKTSTYIKSRIYKKPF